MHPPYQCKKVIDHKRVKIDLKTTDLIIMNSTGVTVVTLHRYLRLVGLTRAPSASDTVSKYTLQKSIETEKTTLMVSPVIKSNAISQSGHAHGQPPKIKRQIAAQVTAFELSTGTFPQVSPRLSSHSLIVWREYPPYP